MAARESVVGRRVKKRRAVIVSGVLFFLRSPDRQLSRCHTFALPRKKERLIAGYRMKGYYVYNTLRGSRRGGGGGGLRSKFDRQLTQVGFHEGR